MRRASRCRLRRSPCSPDASASVAAAASGPIPFTNSRISGLFSSGWSLLRRAITLSSIFFLYIVTDFYVAALDTLLMIESFAPTSLKNRSVSTGVIILKNKSDCF
jgi:hypothetical protein